MVDDALGAPDHNVGAASDLCCLTADRVILSELQHFQTALGLLAAAPSEHILK
jgi:hypothetical protein